VAEKRGLGAQHGSTQRQFLHEVVDVSLLDV
jgi:hypothetical protein